MATTSSRKRSKPVEEDYDDNIVAFPQNENVAVSIMNTPTWFEFVYKMMASKNEVDVEALTAPFEEEYVRTRRGDFGKTLKYIPAKFIRERLNEVLQCKWSFFPILEQRVSDPFQTYRKSDEEYVDSAKYIKILGVLAIPGLGVQVQYGVKKTYGSTESTDWKAATTDAFKKCCAAFGIEADYDIDDEGDDENAPSGEVDLDEVEYDDDSLAEALETEVSFGKYKDFNMEEILDEDPDYLEWLAGNAREKAIRNSALIVLKYHESKKKSRSKSTKSASSKTRKTTSKSSASSSKKTTSTRTKKHAPVEDDDEREELIEQINEIFEESDEYDTVTIKELIKSISTSKKNPNGKRKLEDLNVKELKALVSVIADDDDEYEDEDDE